LPTPGGPESSTHLDSSLRPVSAADADAVLGFLAAEADDEDDDLPRRSPSESESSSSAPRLPCSQRSVQPRSHSVSFCAMPAMPTS
jgi:hypothetical protein